MICTPTSLYNPGSIQTRKTQLTQRGRATAVHVWKPSTTKSVARGRQTTGG